MVVLNVLFQNDVNNLKDEMINEIREKIRHLEDERTQPASYIMADFCNMHKVYLDHDPSLQYIPH